MIERVGEGLKNTWKRVWNGPLFLPDLSLRLSFFSLRYVARPENPGGEEDGFAVTVAFFHGMKSTEDPSSRGKKQIPAGGLGILAHGLDPSSGSTNAMPSLPRRRAAL